MQDVSKKTWIFASVVFILANIAAGTYQWVTETMREREIALKSFSVGCVSAYLQRDEEPDYGFCRRAAQNFLDNEAEATDGAL